MEDRMRYYWLSLLSGCVWAAIALILASGAFGELIVGGLIAAPFIGLLVGLLYRPAYRLPKAAQAFGALLTLYLAVALFGLAVGAFDALWRDIPDRTGTGEVILQAMLAALWGVTFSGYVLLLWPLSFFNHRLLDNRGRAA
jgi:hypothetical protein